MNLLPTNAALLARAVAALQVLDDTPLTIAAIAAGQSVETAAAALHHLVSAGLATTTASDGVILDPALLDALPADGQSPVQGMPTAREMRARVVHHIAGTVTRSSSSTEIRNHGAELLAAVRLGASGDDRELLATTVTLALTVIRAVPPRPPSTHDTVTALFEPVPPPVVAGATDSDLLWWDEFTNAVEPAAIAARDPSALAEIIEHRACCANQRDELAAAERQWGRVIALRERQRDNAFLIAALTAVSDFYRAWPRLERALDCDHQVITVQREAEDRLGHARALARLGVTLKLASRHDAAVQQFELAKAAYRAGSSPDPQAQREHAATCVELGRVLWSQGKQGLARRSFSDALAMVVDLDETGSDEIRALLKQGPG